MSELLRQLSRKLIDEEMFQLVSSDIKSEQQALELRAKELKSLVSKEQENEGSIQAFQQEIQRFLQLEIAKDGNITIRYDFRNPLLTGA